MKNNLSNGKLLPVIANHITNGNDMQELSEKLKVMDRMLTL